MRKIVHVDMDAFYASIEQRDDPALRGRPLVVGGRPESRGVVAAASYEVRKYGVHSAMPCSKAKRLCPEAVFIPVDMEKYKRVSREIRAIFQRHTTLVEPLSLDEAYLDVTEELTGLSSATASAEAIRAEIRAETGLTASAGAAPNKFLAKIASDWRKPDGLFVIRPHQAESFLSPLPVRKLPGVGPATDALLKSHGITTVESLRRFQESELTSFLGKFGRRLWELARGIDDSPVEPSRPLKSISSENTFPHDLTLAEVGGYLSGLAGELWPQLMRRRSIGRTVTVKLRDSSFRTLTRRLTLDAPPETAEALAAVAVQLLERFTFPPSSRFRLAGITMSTFEAGEENREPEQGALFCSDEETRKVE